jgi:hypothetical protein
MMLRILSDGKQVSTTMGKVRKEFEKTEKEAAARTGRMQRSFSKLSAGLAAGGLAIAGGVAAFAKSGFEKYQAYGKDVLAMQRMTGAGAESASALVAEMKAILGTSFDAGASLVFFSKNVGLAKQGTGPAADVLKKYGIDLKDVNGQWRDGAEILREFRDKVSEVSDANVRNSDIAVLMGRSYRNMLGYFTKGTDDMEEYRKKLKDMGLVWDDKDMEKFKTLMGDQKLLAMYQLATQIKMGELVGTIEQKLMPAMLKVADIVNKIPSEFILAAGAIALVVGGLNAMKTATSLLGSASYLPGVGRGIGGLYRIMRNGMPFTAARLAMGKWLRGMAGSGGAISTLNGNLKTLANGGLAMARGGFGKLTGLVKNLPALLTSTGGIYGLIAAGIAVDSYLIYEAVKAWQDMRDAIRQAEEAYLSYKQNTAGPEYQPGGKYYEAFKANPGKYQSMEQINAAAEADRFKYDWWMGPGGWLYNAGLKLPGFAAGGDFVTKGTTLFAAGEKTKERVTITPATRAQGGGLRGARDGLTIEQNFYGPVVGGEAGLREFSKRSTDMTMSGILAATGATGG